jgi:hypothetical protein
MGWLLPLIVEAQTTCYNSLVYPWVYTDKEPVAAWLPCNTSSAISNCCSPDDYCMSNGLCMDAVIDNVISQQGCTDKTWAGSCQNYCSGTAAAHPRGPRPVSLRHPHWLRPDPLHPLHLNLTHLPPRAKHQQLIPVWRLVLVLGYLWVWASSQLYAFWPGRSGNVPSQEMLYLKFNHNGIPKRHTRLLNMKWRNRLVNCEGETTMVQWSWNLLEQHRAEGSVVELLHSNTLAKVRNGDTLNVSFCCLDSMRLSGESLEKTSSNKAGCNTKIAAMILKSALLVYEHFK